MKRTSSSEPISLIRTTPPTPVWLGDEVAKSFDAIKEQEDLSTLMRSHKFMGTDEDKQVAGDWLSRRFGEMPASGRIIMTNGTQNGLMIALNHTIGRGNILLAEKLGYYGIRKLARLLGVTVLPVEMDEDGALPSEVERLCRELKPKGLFLTPTLHNPTTGVMSLERRKKLAEVARRFGLAIIEDDVYGMLPSDAPPPLAVVAPDVTWHSTSPAKCVAPGLRIGYLVTPSAKDAAAAFEPVNTTSTWFASPLSAALMKHWVRSGAADRILRSIQNEAIERQKIAVGILEGAEFRTHPESLFLWLTLPQHWQDAAFVDAAAERGLIIRPGSLFSVDPDYDPQATRIVLGAPKTRDELTTALHGIADLVGEKK